MSRVRYGVDQPKHVYNHLYTFPHFAPYLRKFIHLLDAMHEYWPNFKCFVEKKDENGEMYKNIEQKEKFKFKDRILHVPVRSTLYLTLLIVKHLNTRTVTLSYPCPKISKY